MNQIGLVVDSAGWLVGAALLALPVVIFFFNTIVLMRRFFYDRRWLGIHRSNVKVISIGNLSAGGTGKTPITEFLARGLLSRGKAVGIVSRGYRSARVEPRHVVIDDAAQFGDEPTWLAQQLPEVPVFVGVDKVATVAALEAFMKRNARPLDVVVADDAFQHRRLHRDVDVVLVDASVPRWHDFLLPLGRRREPLSSLSRADLIILTKVNLATPERLVALRTQIQSMKSAKALVFEFESILTEINPLPRSEELISRQSVDFASVSARVLLVSAIARPETFRRLLIDAGFCRPQTIVGHLVFHDHHVFTAADFQSVKDEVTRLSATAILCTEKDAVKMRDCMAQVPVFVSRQVVCPKGEGDEIFQTVLGLLR